MNQLQTPGVYERVDPVALGSQALNDKGMHAGRKGWAGKPPKQIPYMDPSETAVSVIPARNGSLVQTMMGSRPTVNMNLSQIVGSQTAVQGGTVSAAGASSKGKVGWILGVAAGLVILSVMAVAVGIEVLSYAPHPDPTPSPTGVSVGVPVLAQATDTPIGTPGSTLAPAQLTPKSTTVNCRYGPGLDFGVADDINVGQTALIKGRSEDSFWWYVVDPNNPKAGCWVGAAAVTASGNTAGVQVVAGPTLPAGKPTRPPKATKPSGPPPTATLLP